MVEAGKSAEAIDFTPYRAVLDVEALHMLQTEIAGARSRLFALRGQSKEDGASEAGGSLPRALPP